MSLSLLKNQLIADERVHQLWSLKFILEYNELRDLLVAKYGEEPMQKKEAQLRAKWEGEINA